MKRLEFDPDPPCSNAAPLPADLPWQARLEIGFANDNGTSRMVERIHYGPLRVQKPLYPEGAQVCHAIIVHPPGGVVGGDSLSIRARVDDGATAFITTPGAAKWYKANGRISQQEVQIEVGIKATLEWLPQESIFFDAAHVQLDNTIDLAADASYIGCEILCFGRTASGESFTSENIKQRTRIRRGGKLVWFEQGELAGGSPSMENPTLLAGKTVCATLIAVGKTAPLSAINAIRQENGISGSEAFGISQLKSVVIARYLGNSSETAKQLMIFAWKQLRPALIGRDATVPRIWNT